MNRIFTVLVILTIVIVSIIITSGDEEKSSQINTITFNVNENPSQALTDSKERKKEPTGEIANLDWKLKNLNSRTVKPHLPDTYLIGRFAKENGDPLDPIDIQRINRSPGCNRSRTVTAFNDSTFVNHLVYGYMGKTFQTKQSLFVWIEGYKPKTVWFDNIKEGERNFAGTITLEKGHKIIGHVYNENINPIPNANVVIYIPGTASVSKYLIAKTNDNGYFECNGLGDENYSIEVEAELYPVEFVDIDSIYKRNINHNTLNLQFVLKIDEDEKEDYALWLEEIRNDEEYKFESMFDFNDEDEDEDDE